MGLLDSVLGAIKGEGGPDASAILGALQGVLAGKGGLAGLGELFKKQGLESMFSKSSIS